MQVNISPDEFYELLAWADELDPEDEGAALLRRILDRKLRAVVAHELYSQYKTAPTDEAREAARQAYLDERGVPQSFRW